MTPSRFEDARLLAARGEAGAARAALDEVLAGQPDHVGALLLLARLLLEERESDEALALSERAAAVAPRSSEALNGLARCLHSLGRDEEALAAAESARRLLGEAGNQVQTGPVYLTLIWCLREMRRYKEALELAEEGLSRTPDAILAQWASTVEEELAEAEKEEC